MFFVWYQWVEDFMILSILNAFENIKPETLLFEFLILSNCINSRRESASIKSKYLPFTVISSKNICELLYSHRTEERFKSLPITTISFIILSLVVQILDEKLGIAAASPDGIYTQHIKTPWPPTDICIRKSSTLFWNSRTRDGLRSRRTAKKAPLPSRFKLVEEDRSCRKFRNWSISTSS